MLGRVARLGAVQLASGSRPGGAGLRKNAGMALGRPLALYQHQQQVRWMATADGKPTVMFLGGGKMAEAMIAGLTSPEHAKDPEKVTFEVLTVDPAKGRREVLSKTYGIETFSNVTNAKDALKRSDMVIIAVKPRTVEALFTQLKKILTKEERNFTVISIVAGLTMDMMRKGLEIDSVCRSMPNTPSTIGEGMTVWSCDKSVDDSIKENLHHLFESCGEQEFVDDEDLMDMSTAISGSGPAYFLMVMEAMVESGVHMGLPRDLATRLVEQTMLGTAHYAAQSKESPTSLRNSITSPGGTTSDALFHLERGGMRTVVSDACWAAFRKSRELGNKDSDIGPEVNR